MSSTSITKIFTLAVDLQKALAKLRRKNSLREPLAIVQVSTTNVTVQVLAWDLEAQQAAKGVPVALKPSIDALKELMPLGALDVAKDGTFTLTRQVAR
jgi:hypothetical protein